MAAELGCTRTGASHALKDPPSWSLRIERATVQEGIEYELNKRYFRGPDALCFWPSALG